MSSAQLLASGEGQGKEVCSSASLWVPGIICCGTMQGPTREGLGDRSERGKGAACAKPWKCEGQSVS